jgi:dihydrofolate reductase
MRNVILYIGTSLDGYIARPDGSVDWLFTEGDYGYDQFYDAIDVTLMGRKTYEQVLSFGAFPYPDKQNYVFTHRPETTESEHVTFVSKDTIGFIRELKAAPGKHIWLIGGGGLIHSCLQDGLVDELRLFIHPILLGDGLPLLPPPSDSVNLEMLDQRVYENGLLELHYRVRHR